MVNLLNLDIMSPSVGFTINKNETYKTYIGFMLTIVYILCIVLAFIGFGKDIVERKKPFVVNNNEITQDSGFMFNSTNFIFSLYIGSWQAIPDYERKFFAYFDVFHNYPGGYNTTTFYFSRCSEETLIDFNRTLSSPRETYYCFQPGTVVNVQKSREDVVYQSSRLVVEYCDNKRHNKTDCLPYEEIKKSTPSFIMSFNFYDYYANSLSYDTPLNRTFYQAAANGAFDTYSRVVITFRNIDFTTDVGWLIEQNKREVVSSVSSITYNNLNTPGGRVLFSHQFLNSQWASIYKRRYIKIQEVFANIGGIVNLVAIILRIVCDFLVKPDIMAIFFNQINKSHLSTENSKSNNLDHGEKNDIPKIMTNNFINNVINNIKRTSVNVNNANFDKNRGTSDFNRLPDKSFDNSKDHNLQREMNEVKKLNKSISSNSSNEEKNKEKIGQNMNNKNDRENNNVKNDNSKMDFYRAFTKDHNRISLKLNLDNHLKRLFNFDYEDFNIMEKLFRPCLCSNSYNSKIEKYERVKEIYNETFSIEYSANNYRKLEIMKFLLFNEVQNKIIDNLDLPELDYYLDFDYNESRKKVLEEDHDDMINFKLKMLIK